MGLTTVASLYTLLMILTTLCNAATTFIINTYLQNWLKISSQILYLLEKYYFLTSNPLLLRILTAIVKHSSRQILTLFFTLRRSKLKFDRLISRSWQIDSINISPKVVFSSASYPMLKVGVSGGGGGGDGALVQIIAPVWSTNVLKVIGSIWSPAHQLLNKSLIIKKAFGEKSIPARNRVKNENKSVTLAAVPVEGTFSPAIFDKITY